MIAILFLFMLGLLIAALPVRSYRRTWRQEGYSLATIPSLPA